MSQIRKALASGFNGSGGGAEPPDVADILFKRYKNNKAPFTAVLADRHATFFDHGSACKKILEYLDTKSSWPRCVVEDLKTTLDGEGYELNNSSVSMVKQAFFYFSGMKDFDEWVKTIVIADGQVARPQFGKK